MITNIKHHKAVIPTKNNDDYGLFKSNVIVVPPYTILFYKKTEKPINNLCLSKTNRVRSILKILRQPPVA